METSYVGGPGILLARGRRWLLLDDDPSADRVHDWWTMLGDSGPVRDRLVAALDIAYPLHDVSLVFVDLDDAGPATTWGQGRVEPRGQSQILSVGVSSAGGPRPLLAGVVSAASVTVYAPAVTPISLIDHIPDEILHSSAPAPTHRTFFRPATYDIDEEAATTMPRVPLPESVTNPPESPEELEAEMAAAAASVFQSGSSDHLRQSPSETVLAVHCPNGHVTPAYTPACRICQAPVPPQEPRRIPRPQLGGLRLPTGELVPLDRGVVFGRKPVPVPGSNDWPHMVHLPQDSTYVSRMHLQIELDGWLVLGRDLGSRGGTTLRIPGRLPQRIRANERYVLEPGHSLDLADSYEIVYEISPEDSP